MAKVRFLGNPKLKTEAEEMRWLAKKLGIDPDKMQVDKVEMPVDEVIKTFNLDEED